MKGQQTKGMANEWSPGRFFRKYGIFLVMIILFIVASTLNKSFLKPQNLLNILKQITPFTIIAAAETILIICGCIDLSAGQVAAMSACFAAGALANTGSVLICFLVGMGSAAVAGLCIGFLSTTFRLPAFIASLAIMNVAEGVTTIYTDGRSIMGVEKLRWLSQGKLFGIPYMILLLVLVLVVIQLILKRTKFGLYMYAIGGNKKASIASGIKVNRNIVFTYLVSGCLVGLAGIALVARMMAGQPGVGPGYEFDGITATIVGGTSFTGGSGSMFSVIAGAVIIGIINNIMILMGVDSNWQMVVKGVLIALAVILDLQTKRTAKAQ